MSTTAAMAKPNFAAAADGHDFVVFLAAQADAAEGAPPAFDLLAHAKLPAAALDAAREGLKKSRFAAKKGDVRLLYGLPGTQASVAVVGVGKQEADADRAREAARAAAGAALQAVRALAPAQPVSLAFAPTGDPQGLAEGAVLAAHSFDELKSQASRAAPASVALLADPGSPEAKAWERGLVLADAQNLARTLAETPANLMTPTIFCERAVAALADPKITVHVRGPEWIEEKKMGLFKSVGQGSSQPQRLLEVHYAGDPAGWDAPKVALVGKGVTFDSGGVSIKPADGMASMRADMMGAAEVVSATLAAAKLGLKINIVTVAGLTENMINGQATKPGDVFFGMNGKSVEVDNTDAEGRLVLADALYYVTSTYKPHSVIDVATLTGAMMIALGSVYTGFFPTHPALSDSLSAAGARAGDRLWPMPLDATYLSQMKSQTADLKNVGGRPGGACTAAAFLREFVDGLAKDGGEGGTRWAHVDVAGVMAAGEADPGYLKRGAITGRPTRALVEWLAGLEGK
ncbi:cytosol aminopeptidase family, catalytic domain-containing protein [Hyaloraphidium curvatum]|nr:cytosol aminopeptidase family, catalytic domain-containing protein [Hyaloraphidium curvatum]